jgi:hypothetical protein
MRVARIAALSCALVGIGCSGTTRIEAPASALTGDDSPAQTDALTYKLLRGVGEWRAHVTVTYYNRTDHPVYYARCGIGVDTPMYGLVRTGADSNRTLFTDWAWACVGGVPTGSIAPGGSVTVQVPLGSVDQPNMQPPLKPEWLTGLMRVQFALCRTFNKDSDYCDPLPQVERRSNAFEVTF